MMMMNLTLGLEALAIDFDIFQEEISVSFLVLAHPARSFSISYYLVLGNILRK